MAERDRKHGQGEAVEAPRNPMYDQLFRKILEVSRLRGESSTRNTANISFRLPNDQSLISISINPCFADEQGRPVFLTLDTYVDGLHSQQVAARATWDELDTPTSEIDSARVGVNRRNFDTEALARMGALAVKTLVPQVEPEKSPPQDRKYLN